MNIAHEARDAIVENAIASILLALGVWVAVLPSTVPGLLLPA